MIARSILTCALLLLPGLAFAQVLGTFRWQAQPLCNVLTLTVTQLPGGMYRLEGADEQCGAARRASATGTAFTNPDSTIGIGLTIVGAPGGAPVHLDATVTPAAGYSGTWRDDFGRTGAFVFTGFTGAPVGPGAPRPLAAPTQGFVHTVTADNRPNGCTILDHPLLENVPAVLAVTHEWDGAYLGSDFSVRRDDSRWVICPATIDRIPLGHKFHVIIK